MSQHRGNNSRSGLVLVLLAIVVVAGIIYIISAMMGGFPSRPYGFGPTAPAIRIGTIIFTVLNLAIPIALLIYVLTLLSRLTRAVERIAHTLERPPRPKDSDTDRHT